MGIPILEDIFNGIKFIINFFMDKAPKPIKLLLFLLFLLLFGSIISFFLHLSGVHCTSDKVVVKNDVIDIAGNLNLIWIKNFNIEFDENVTLDEVHPYRDIGFGICQRQYRLTDLNCYELCDNISDSDCNYYYDGGQDCYSCDETIINPCQETNDIFQSNNIAYCSGDATSIEWSWIQKWLQCNRRCEIPNGYNWDSDTGQYQCIDLDICGTNATNRPETRLDDALIQTGATALYTDSGEKDYRRALTIKCDNDLDPVLTFFGIPIFDYKIWLILIVIGVMFLFLSKIVKH